jgi:hypothetical protein
MNGANWSLALLGRRDRMDMFADATIVALIVTLFALCFGMIELCDRT